MPDRQPGGARPNGPPGPAGGRRLLLYVGVMVLVVLLLAALAGWARRHG